MNRQNFGRCSGVIIDFGNAHGVWFDPDELTAVLEFVATGGLAKARARDLAHAQSELRNRRLDAMRAQQDARRMSGAQVKFSSGGALVIALSLLDW